MNEVIGVFPNLEKEKVLSVLDELVAFCKKENIKIVLPYELGEKYCCDTYKTDAIDSLKKFTVGISLGGDGTFLNMTKYTSSLKIPVAGINIGRKGFLTEIEIHDMKNALKKIAIGSYKIEERFMVKSIVLRDNKVVLEASALNDVVLEKGIQGKMVRLSLNINKSEKNSFYSADGIVFASSTGSTAYSLSAGGPIVDPSLDIMIITPICPHAFTRPLIVPSESEIVVTLQSPQNEAILSNDGVYLERIYYNDVVKVKRSEFKAKFIKLDNSSYYDTWQERLTKGETF